MAVTFVSDANKDELLKDEWITIADVITTEDVKNISFTTDVNGNPFTCKKVVCQVLFPANCFTSYAGITWGIYAGWCAEYTSFSNENTKFNCSMECLGNGVAIFGMNQSSGGENYIGWRESSFDVRYSEEQFGSLITTWTIHNYSEDTPNNIIPAGTKVKVWGLKA